MIDERPPEKIVQGSPGERDALIRAHQTRRLTDGERMRLAALTWTPDEALERARLIRDRHPDLLPEFKVHPTALDAYEATRNRAIEGGRDFPKPDKATIAALDNAAKELRTVLAAPIPNVKDVNRRGRAAFRAAIVTDWAAGMAAWQTWLGELADVDSHARRRSHARSALGLQSVFTDTQRPQFTRELDQAAGGATGWTSFGGPGAMVAER